MRYQEKRRLNFPAFLRLVRVGQVKVISARYSDYMVRVRYVFKFDLVHQMETVIMQKTSLVVLVMLRD